MDAVAVAAGIGAFCGAGIGIGVVSREVYKAWSKIDDFLSDWNGEHRFGHVITPSMPERVGVLEAQMQEIQKQVTPNGGDTQSLGDRVVRIEARGSSNGLKLDQVGLDTTPRPQEEE